MKKWIKPNFIYLNVESTQQTCSDIRGWITKWYCSADPTHFCSSDAPDFQYCPVPECGAPIKADCPYWEES